MVRTTLRHGSMRRGHLLGEVTPSLVRHACVHHIAVDDRLVEQLVEGKVSFPRLCVRAQCPIGWVCGSASPIAVAAAEHSGWPNPLALTPFVKS